MFEVQPGIFEVEYSSQYGRLLGWSFARKHIPHVRTYKNALFFLWIVVLTPCLASAFLNAYTTAKRTGHYFQVICAQTRGCAYQGVWF